MSRISSKSSLKLVAVAAAVASTLALSGAPADGSAAPKARTFKNCTALNRVYPHGVGRPRAHDHTSGTPVTSFKRSAPLYNANAKSDRDKDGIACEKA